MTQTIGKVIMMNRKKLGLTQEQLAEQLGVTAQAVSKWENDLSCPDISVLPQLADIFSITTDELLGRPAPQQVFAAEVIDSPEEDEDDSDKGLFEMTWDSGRNSAIIAASIVLFAGVFFLIARLFSCDLSFWSILWPSALIVWGAVGLFPKFSFFRLCCLLAGCFFLVGRQIYELDNSIVFGVIVVLLGGCLLADALKKDRKPKFKVKYTDKTGKVHLGEHHNDYNCTEDTFCYSATFGSSTQCVYLDTLKKGEVSTSFGEYTIDLTGIKKTAANCRLDLSCSFGELTLLLPRQFGIQLENSTSFGEIHTTGQSDEAISGTIHVVASVSFGEIEVRYI